MLDVGMILDSRYEVLAKIGQGGMSTVYKALDKKLNRFVALKVLKEEFSSDEEFVDKFRKEAQSVASLVHPNIVAAYDAVDEGDVHYIVMELVEGRSLKYRIQHHGMLGSDAAIEISLQTAEGIAAAHKNGIIHRDIKPQNILISRNGAVKVADFGIAKAVTGETISTAVLGSAHYVSPEQSKKGYSDERSDIYSLGITMYEMVTGQLPFDGENTVSVVMAHINKPMVPPEEIVPDVYPALNDIILKATRKNPSDRYQTANEMIEDLKRCKEDPDGDFVFPDTEKEDEEKEETGTHKKKPEKSNTLFNVINKNVIFGFVAAAIVCILLAVGIFIINDDSTGFTSNEKKEASENVNASKDVSIEVTDNQLLVNLIGKNVEDAKSELNIEKVSLVINKEEYNDTYLSGIIIAQSPEEGSTVKSGDKVYVTVSLGSKLDSVLKSLKGITVEEATSLLKDVEVSVLGVKRQFSQDVPEGMVIGYILNDNTTDLKENQTEETQIVSESVSGEKITKGSSIILLISAGKEEEGIHVPSLIGLQISDASAVLNTNGLILGTISKVPSGDSRDGKITSQSDSPNTAVKKGKAIDVVINWDPDQPLSYETTQTGNVDPNSETELSPEFWYGSIDTVYTVGGDSGPAIGANVMNICIRLHQRLDDNDEYSIISEPKPMACGSQMPISYRYIRGSYGVQNGIVEVYDVDKDTVVASYPITFYPL